EPLQVLHRAPFQVTVGGVHRRPPIDDAIQQFVRIDSRDDGTGPIVLGAQPWTRKRSPNRQVALPTLSVLGVVPVAILVVVFQAEHHPRVLSMQQQSFQTLNPPAQPLVSYARASLPGKDTAVPPAEARGDTDHPPGLIHFPSAL